MIQMKSLMTSRNQSYPGLNWGLQHERHMPNLLSYLSSSLKTDVNNTFYSTTQFIYIYRNESAVNIATSIYKLAQSSMLDSQGEFQVNVYQRCNLTLARLPGASGYHDGQVNVLSRLPDWASCLATKSWAS